MEDHLQRIAICLSEFFQSRRRLLLAVGLLSVFLLFLFASNRDVQPHQFLPPSPNHVVKNGEIPAPEGFRSLGVDTKEANAPAALHLQAELYRAGPGDSTGLLRAPRIAYSAELSVVTKEFAHARSTLEEILERHRGYVAKLRMVGQPLGSVLSATLRVPSSEYRSALAELKGVGLVEHEEEAADEITQQHSELEARLVNAQNEEQRLLQLLQNRSEKTKDPGALERQVSLLRSDIERMEAERYASGSRVSFANVFIALREERTPAAETIGAKLGVAVISGLSDALESVSTILLFLAGRGPLLVLWVGLLYLPARFFWRRYRRSAATV